MKRKLHDVRLGSSGEIDFNKGPITISHKGRDITKEAIKVIKWYSTIITEGPYVGPKFLARKALDFLERWGVK